MPSPRENLRAAFVACLLRIKQIDGYITDAGNYVTLEPGPVSAGDDDKAFITVVISGQARATDPALLRTHRKTTVSVVAKLPAKLSEVQSRLDAVVTDIETAMADQQFRFPVGHQFPAYESMAPLVPQATDKWVGAVLTYTSHIPIKATP